MFSSGYYRFKHKPTLPWTAINASVGVLVITLLVGHIFYAAISRIAEVEEDYHETMELKVRAEAADVAKSQVHPCVFDGFYLEVSLVLWDIIFFFAESSALFLALSCFLSCSFLQLFPMKSGPQ